MGKALFAKGADLELLTFCKFAKGRAGQRFRLGIFAVAPRRIWKMAQTAILNAEPWSLENPADCGIKSFTRRAVRYFGEGAWVG
jgi:hypothetical protein